jgi:4-diphosphocytidyl-2-C-methyl-D-erythritol kinase
MLSVSAPAKLNLTLEVLGKRPDGYHEIRSVIQTVNLCDTILFCVSSDIEFHSSTPDWRAELSLVSRAVKLVKETTGCARGAAIGVIKNIPLMAGLGGDSSDAASVLAGLNEFWNLGLSPPAFLDMAAQLGSDVPLFLYGGTLLCEGRGERVTPLPSFPQLWAVILVPPVPRETGKTGQLYAALSSGSYTGGEMTDALVGVITHEEEAELNLNEWGIGQERYTNYLFNVFESIAYDKFPGLAGYRDEFLEAGAPAVHLAGSGPALFALFFSQEEAGKVYLRLKEKGLECFLTSTRDSNK